MKRASAMSALVQLIAIAMFMPAAARAATEKSVCVLTIHEEITRNTLYLVRRGLREADRKNAAALVLDMRTNGGRLDVTEDIIRLLERAPMKTYTFVDGQAYSAGAIIAGATDKIFMTPGSVIGAATPILMIPGGGVSEAPTAEREKMNSAARALENLPLTPKEKITKAIVDMLRITVENENFSLYFLLIAQANVS